MIQIQYPHALISAAADMGVELPACGFSFDAEEPLLEFNEQLIDLEAADFHGEHSDFGISDFHVIQPKWREEESFEIDDFQVINGPLNAHGEADFGLNLGSMVKKVVKRATGVQARPAPKPSAKVPSQVSGAIRAATAHITAAARVAATPKAAAVSFTIPKGVSVQTAMAGADKLLGDPKVKNPAQVINNTKAMAALGVPNAQRAVAVLDAVEKIRAAAKVPIGKAAISIASPVNTAQLTATITPELAKRMASLRLVAKGAKPTTPLKQASATVVKPVVKIADKAAAAVKGTVKPKTSTVSVDTQKNAGFWFKVKKFFGLAD